LVTYFACSVENSSLASIEQWTVYLEMVSRFAR